MTSDTHTILAEIIEAAQKAFDDATAAVTQEDGDLIERQRASRNFTPTQEKKIAADLAKEIPHRAGEIVAAFGLAEALEDAT